LTPFFSPYNQIQLLLSPTSLKTLKQFSHLLILIELSAHQRGAQYLTAHQRGAQYLTAHQKGAQYLTAHHGGAQYLTARKEGAHNTYLAVQINDRI
jgi:hypothetical protein